MSPFLVRLPFFYDFGFTFEPGSEAYRHFSESFAYVFFDMCSIDFNGGCRRPREVQARPGTVRHGGGGG